MSSEIVVAMLLAGMLIMLFCLDIEKLTKCHTKIDELDNRIRNLEIHELKAVVDQPGINTRCNELENRINNIESKIVLPMLEALLDEPEE